MRTENQIEMSFIEKLKDLKYTYRDDIRARSVIGSLRDEIPQAGLGGSPTFPRLPHSTPKAAFASGVISAPICSAEAT